MGDISTKGPAARAALVLTACLTAALIPLSIAGPAVLVPAIGRELGGSAVALTWLINAYLLTYGSATLAAGSLADTYGRKRVWLAGIALFSIVTAAIPAAPSVVWIDILRLVQGIAASAAFAGCMAALTQEFTGHARMRVFSLIGTTFGAGAAFGPLVCGILVDTLGWRAAFLFPALLGVAASILVAATARDSRDPGAAGLDWPGAISFTAALAIFTYGILLAPQEGWSSPWIVGLLAAAALIFAGFIAVERHRAWPMLDLSLFRSPRFVGVQVLAVAPAYTYVALIVLLPARLIGIDGYGAMAAGQLLIALSAPLLVVPVLAGLLLRWIGAGVLSGVGLLVAAIGLGWLGDAMAAGAAGPAIVMPLLLIGIGIGLPWGLMDGLAVSVVPKEQAGMAAGIFNVVRLAGDGLALAAVGAVLSARIAGGLPASTDAAGRAEATARLAMSDLASAIAASPGLGRPVLLQVYEAAFRFQLFTMAAVAVILAIAVFALFGRSHAVSPAPDLEAGE